MDRVGDSSISETGEEVVSSKRIFSGRIIGVRVDEVRLSDARSTGSLRRGSEQAGQARLVTREVVEHPGAVALVPLTADGKVLLVRQYRLPVGQFLQEVPAGTMREGEEPEECAQRELAEEVGFTAGQLVHLTSFYTAPGFCTELMHCFLCRDLAPVGRAPDPDERLEVEAIPLPRAADMARKGLIRDAKSVVSLLLAEALTKDEG